MEGFSTSSHCLETMANEINEVLPLQPANPFTDQAAHTGKENLVLSYIKIYFLIYSRELFRQKAAGGVPEAFTKPWCFK